MSDDLLSLAARCEAASRWDRELDEAIADALFERSQFAQLKGAPLGTGFMTWWQDGHQQSALRYTASLDAATTLVPKNHEWAVNWAGNSAAEVFALPDGPSHKGYAATPALALTAACLKARAQEGVSND